MASLYTGGLPVSDAARANFIDAMSTASVVVAVIAGLGALIAWRYLPASAGGRRRPLTQAGATPQPGK
jgi:hypothetical protein